MQLKNNMRVTFDEGINEHISYKRVLQKINCKSNYLLVNIPRHIVKTLNLSSQQYVIVKLSRDDQNKPIIVIVPADHKENNKRAANKGETPKEKGIESVPSVDLKETVSPNESPV